MFKIDKINKDTLEINQSIDSTRCDKRDNFIESVNRTDLATSTFQVSC